MGAEPLAESSLLFAVSGGSDSMALLELGALARGERIRDDVVVTVDHGQRLESADDGTFVMQTCARRFGCGAEIRAAGAPPGADEATLRTLRYRAFAETAAARGCRFIVTGHTRDDQIETTLHRLFRGAGRGGLGGIRARRDALVRPLLGFRRSELRDFLRFRGAEWRDDASNEDLRFTRNRWRHELIPAIERAVGKGVVDHLADLAPLWAAEDDYLESEAARYAIVAIVRGVGGDAETSSAPPPVGLDLAALAAVPAALATRVVRRWLAMATTRAPSSFTERELRDVVALATARPSGETRRVELHGVEITERKGRLRALVRKPAAADVERASRTAQPSKHRASD